MQRFNHRHSGGTVEGLIGSDAGPLFLLLHASGTGADALRGLAARLSPYFQVMIPNLHGYGGSGSRVANASIAAHLDVIQGLLQYLGRQPALVFGHSMGGLIALKALSQNLLSPDALVLMEPTAFGILSETVPHEHAALVTDRAMIQSMQAALTAGNDALALNLFTEIWNDVPYRDMPQQAQAHLRRIIPQIAAEAPWVSADPTGIEEYCKIRQPVLLLQSAKPPAPIPPILQKLAANLTDIRLHNLADTGHMGPVMRPDLYFSAMAPFLNMAFPIRGLK